MKRVVLGLVLGICLSFFSCKQKQQQPQSSAVPVNLYTVTSQRVLYYDNFPSTVRALSQVDLTPQVQGNITGIFFKEGSKVTKGQKLYEMDRRIYQDNYDAAVSNLKVAEGNVSQAKQDADRYEYLNTYNAIAKQVLDHAVISLQNAKNQQQASEQAVKTAKTNLGYAIITAPFDGTIGFSQVKLGNFVNAGATVLNTISTINPMAVDFVINEKQLPHFEEIASGSKEAPDSLFTILLADNSVYPYPGKISVIDRAVDAETGSIRIRVVFSNPQDILRPGMSCVLRVHNQDADPKLLVPGKATIEQMGEYFVFVARDTLVAGSPDSSHKEKSDTVQPRPKLMAFQKKVQLGRTIGPNVIVESGIKEGDKVVVDGVQSLHQGAEITTLNKMPASSQNGRGGTGLPAGPS